MTTSLLLHPINLLSQKTRGDPDEFVAIKPALVTKPTPGPGTLLADLATAGFDPYILPRVNYSDQVVAQARAYAQEQAESGKLDCRTSIHVAVIFSRGNRHTPLVFGHNSVMGGARDEPSCHAEIDALRKYCSLCCQRGTQRATDQWIQGAKRLPKVHQWEKGPE